MNEAIAPTAPHSERTRTRSRHRSATRAADSRYFCCWHDHDNGRHGLLHVQDASPHPERSSGCQVRSPRGLSRGSDVRMESKRSLVEMNRATIDSRPWRSTTPAKRHLIMRDHSFVVAGQCLELCARDGAFQEAVHEDLDLFLRLLGQRRADVRDELRLDVEPVEDGVLG